MLPLALSIGGRRVARRRRSRGALRNSRARGLRWRAAALSWLLLAEVGLSILSGGWAPLVPGARCGRTFELGARGGAPLGQSHPHSEVSWRAECHARGPRREWRKGLSGLGGGWYTGSRRGGGPLLLLGLGGCRPCVPSWRAATTNRSDQGASAVEYHRIGEAQNPGPPAGEDLSEPQVPDDADWVPAWKRWSVPMVHPREGSRPAWVELVPPHLVEVTRDEMRGHEWDDAELELFLQRSEVDAGLRESLDVDEAQRIRAAWHEAETDLMVLGIQPPLLPPLEGDSAVTAAQGDARTAALPLSKVEAAARPGGSGGRSHGRPGRRGRQVWRPLAAPAAGDPPIVEAHREPVESANNRMNVEAAQGLAAALGSSQPARREHRRPPRRPRGRRMRGELTDGEDWTMDIVQFNSSGVPQLVSALDSLADSRRRTAALMVQEHHARGDALVDLDGKARAMGWKMAAAPATDGRRGGSSAGSAVLVPSHLDWGTAPGGLWDLSPPGSPGRLSAAWIRAGPKCGLLVMSCYFWTTEGPTARNLGLLETGLRAAAALGLPWVMGADANMTPEQLATAAKGMLGRAGAVIRRSGRPTNYPAAGSPREIDFFLLDEKLASAASEAYLDPRVAGEPHRAVCLRLDGKLTGGLVQVASKPRGFPQSRPIGCPRRPVVPDGMMERLDLDRRGDEMETKVLSDDEMDAAWVSLAYSAEAELCRQCDLVDGEGCPLPQYLGRGEGFVLKWKPILPPRVCGSVGGADARLHRLMLVLNRLEELVHLARAIERRGGGPSSGQLAQWHRVVFNLRRCRGPLSVLCGEGTDLSAVLVSSVASIGRPGGSLGTLMKAATAVRVAVDERKAQLSSERASAWKAWVAMQVRRGGGALHKFTKRQLEHAPDALDFAALDRRGAPQNLVDQDLSDWSGIWRRLEGIATAPWRDAELSQAHLLPRPLPVELRRASASFSPHTGVGGDHFRPVWFSWLSDPLLACFADVFMSIEAVGRWPRRLRLALIHLIPKEAGGRRPIGLLASFVRLWERVRAPHVRQWRLDCRRSYNWSAPGRSAERAAWVQTVTDEAARERGMVSASTLIDLVKAFEHIPLALMWRQAVKHRFPLVIMRLVLELCAGPRRLVFRRAVSNEVSTLTAVIAGLVMATDCMFLAIIDVMDDLVLRFPAVRARTYVDDLTLSSIGGGEEVSRELNAATAECVRQLEDVCGLVVSRRVPGRSVDSSAAKSVAVASTKKMRRALAPVLRKIGLRVVVRTKFLGVDYCPGPSRGPKRPVQAQRWEKVHRRRGRVQRLGAVGGRHVVATGVVPSAKYGAAVTGTSCLMIRQLGTMAAEAFGRMGGRSVTARLAVRGADHRVDILLRPLRAWCEEVWRGEVDSAILRDAWMWAQKSVGLSANPARAATTAAAAFISTLARLLWKSPSYDSVLTREGHLLQIGVVDVSLVMRMAVDDMTAVLAADSEVAKDMADLSGDRGYYRTLPGRVNDGINVVVPGAGDEHIAGSTPSEAHAARIWRGGRYQAIRGRMVPWFLPSTMVLRRRLADPRRCTAADLSAAALIEGGWFTPARLHALGLRPDAACRLCGAAAGTTWHRTGACSRTEDTRVAPSGGCPPWLLKKGLISVWDPLFSRGVPALPKIPSPPREAVRWGPGGRPSEAAAAMGDVFTDGAVSGRWRRIMRAGWGLVALADGEDKALWAQYGAMADLQPSVVRAELRAVLEALRIAVPPLRIHVDNAEVVQGWGSTREWCTDPGRDGADIWAEIWRRKEDIGEGVQLVKVKAHTDVEAISDGTITARERVGNALADRYARMGASLAELMSPTKVARAELVKAVRWHFWTRRVAATWQRDTGEEGTEAAVGRASAESRGSAPRASGLRHLLWEKGGDLMCRRCGRVADTDLKRRDIHSSRCLGSAAGRLLRSACDDPGVVGRICAVGYFDMTQRGWRSRDPEDRDPRTLEEQGFLFDEAGDDVEVDADRGDDELLDGPRPNEDELLGPPPASSPGPTGAAASPHHGSSSALCSVGAGRKRRSSGSLEGASAARSEAVDAVLESGYPKDVRRRLEVGPTAQGSSGIDVQAGAEEARLQRIHRGKRPRASSASSTAPSPLRHRVSAGAAASSAARSELARPGSAFDDPEADPLSEDSEVAAGELAAASLPVQTVPAPASRSRSRSPEQAAAPADGAHRRSFGRRRVPGRADPVDALDAKGHTLVVTGPVVWCEKCGRYAARRVGRALRARCPEAATGAYATRLARLRAGRHPLTGEALIPG